MSLEITLRIANSPHGLDELLTSIESGAKQRPDWIRMQGSMRLDRLPLPELEKLVQRLHPCVLRGFKCREPALRTRAARIEYWRAIARNGFHNFATEGWTKCYDSPFVEDYDYLRGYLERGIDGLDPYLVYSAVLGTHDYSVDDFVRTPRCEKVETIVEPMAGTGDFSYHGHFQYPELRYLMFDLDEQACEHVMARPWLEGSDRRYMVANVLDLAIWKRIKKLSRGRSLSYIGKQSHHLFGPRELYRLLEIGTAHVDYFMLETPEPSLAVDLDDVEDLSRPEMEDAGFHTGLVEQEDRPRNPFTNEMAFRLDVWNARGRRTLFSYPDWTSWQQPMLVAIARLLDLEISYLNEDEGDFVNIDVGDHSDQLDNVTFMIFQRR